MRIRPSPLVAGIAGLVAGGLTMIVLAAPAVEIASDAGTDSPPLGTAPLRTAPAQPPSDPVLLAWTAGGLPTGFADAVRELPLVEDVATVAGGRVDLVSSHRADGTVVDRFDPGWGVPLDALAIDPASYAAFVPVADRPTLAALAPGEALLGSTSAELRRLAAGDSVTLASGSTLTIAGTVDDVVAAGAELLVSDTDAADLGIDVDRFVLVSHRGARAELESAIRSLVRAEVRVRGPGETPFLRHGDAVLPQALVKQRFGEFAYRIPADDRVMFEPDPTWARDHLVTATLPILGPVHCHRDIIAQVHGALEELVTAGLDHLVDPDAFQGCYNPRLIAPGAAVSRHAWGIALDVNAELNPTGHGSGQDPRLVDTFARWGLTWGGFWLVPDPMHFEYLTDPAVDPAKVVGGSEDPD